MNQVDQEALDMRTIVILGLGFIGFGFIGFRVSGLGFRVWDFQSLGFRACQGLAFKEEGVEQK